VGPLEKAHAGLLLAKDGPAAPIPPPGRLRIDVGADTGTDTFEATAEAAPVTGPMTSSSSITEPGHRA
jgi:hypothetical protein